MYNGVLLTAADAAAANPYGGIIMVVYIIVIIGFIYFFMIRPQRNEQKKKTAMLGNIEVGDSVLTTAGFYGTIIDVADDTVIVEFGNNKNCRIPMQKNAIVQLEKAGSATEESTK